MSDGAFPPPNTDPNPHANTDTDPHSNTDTDPHSNTNPHTNPHPDIFIYTATHYPRAEEMLTDTCVDALVCVLFLSAVRSDYSGTCTVLTIFEKAFCTTLCVLNS